MFVTWLFGPPKTPYVGLRTVRAAHLKLIKQRGFCQGKCALCSPGRNGSLAAHRGTGCHLTHLVSDSDTWTSLVPYRRRHNWRHTPAYQG